MSDARIDLAPTSTAHGPAAASAVAPAESAPGRLDRAVEAAAAKLRSLQNADGHWRATLEGGSITESEYILLKWILGQEDDPDLPPIANALRDLQSAEGGWLLFPGGPADISATVQGYFALKLMGDDPGVAHMQRAREVIMELGGAERANTFTRFYLACLGQVSFDACPSIPPEVILLPRWFPLNLYNMSAWTRTMVLPLGLVTTLKPRREIPAEKGIGELFRDPSASRRLTIDPPRGIPTTWRDLFLRIDQVLKLYNRFPFKPFRKLAIRRAERWLIEHNEDSDGLGAIFPPMVYMLVVYRLLGYAEDHELVVKGHRDLKDFFIREGDRIRVQPCFSPGWDTGIALHAMAETGLSPASDTAERGVRWLLAHECRIASDWAKNCPGVPPSGWYFEYANPHYPDTDDTAMAVVSLRRLGSGAEADAAADRGRDWLLALQNDDGGWAAFDRTKNRPILEHVPFADHNAMQDPSCPDITGRVLEGLGHSQMTVDHPAIQRAKDYLRREQDASGAWWGRWGVNFVYGTWQVLVGLKAVGEDMSAGYVRRAAEWLRSVQNADGSFGETPDTYRDPSLKGTGEPTASQTAWGAMGMMAIFGPDDASVRRALDWLIDTQNEDGDWTEPWFTGTGFPEVYYLRYHLYKLYFPLMALARARRLSGA